MEVVKLSCVPGRNQRKKPFLSRGHWFTAQLLEGLLSSVGCTVYLGYTLNRPSNNLRDFIFYFIFQGTGSSFTPQPTSEIAKKNTGSRHKLLEARSVKPISFN